MIEEEERKLELKVSWIMVSMYMYMDRWCKNFQLSSSKHFPKIQFFSFESYVDTPASFCRSVLLLASILGITQVQTFAV